MTVNINKTKEIVFHRPSARHSLPIPLIGIEQVLSAKLLGVTFCSNLKFDDHVKNVLTICSQCCYLLMQVSQRTIVHLHVNLTCKAA